MKQQINLLPLLPTFEKRIFSLMTLLCCDVLVVVMLMAIYFFLRTGVNEKASLLAQEEAVYQATEMKWLQTQKQFSREERVAAFNKKAEALGNEAEEKSKLVAILSSGKSKNITGFSRYLDELGNKIVQGVALTAIEINEGGKSIEMEGQAISINAALSFASRLDHDSVFGDKTFTLSRLDKSADRGYLTIRLSNTNHEGDKGSQ